MPLIRIKRGTKAQLEAARTAGQLQAGEPYFVTDLNAFALGIGTNAYQLYTAENQNPRKFSQRLRYSPGNTTTVGAPNGFTLATGGTGTVSHNTPTSADWVRRTLWASGATAGNANGLRMTHNPFFRQVGWQLSCIATWINGVSGQLQIGLTTGAALAGEPSAVVNQICVGYDSTDTNLHLMHNDGTGVATKVDLGVARTAPVIFRLDIDCDAGSNPVVSIVNVYTNAVILAPTTLNTDIMTVTQSLAFVAHCRNTVTTPPSVGLANLEAIVNP
jgi:hypothetical protein